MLFQYNADPEARYTLYETAKGELGEYVLYVEKGTDKNFVYCFGENSNGMQWLTPQIDSIPDDDDVEYRAATDARMPPRD